MATTTNYSTFRMAKSLARAIEVLPAGGVGHFVASMLTSILLLASTLVLASMMLIARMLAHFDTLMFGRFHARFHTFLL
jgi:hypothetical protein